MSQRGNSLIYILLGVLVLVGLGAGYYIKTSSSNTVPVVSPSKTITSVVPTISASSSASSATTTGIDNKSNISDAQIDKDFKDIQGSMDKLSSDVNTSNLDTSNEDIPQ